MPSSAAAAAPAPAAEPQLETRLDAALRAVLAAPPPPPGATMTGLLDDSSSMLQELHAALAAAPRAVPAPELCAALQAALELDQEGTRARAVHVMRRMPTSMLAKVGRDKWNGSSRSCSVV